MIILPSVLISGIFVGCIYSLLAIGFVLVYKSSRVFNLAQGEFLLFGACFGWVLAADLGLSIWMVILITMSIGGGLGLIVYRIVVKPLIGMPLVSLIMATIALSSVLKGLLVGIWSSPPYAYPWGNFFNLVLPEKWGGIIISGKFLMASAVAACLIIFFLFFFNYTKLGLGMRAVAEDQQAAQSLGIRVRKIFALTWVIAVIVGSVGGILMGQLLSVTPELAKLGLIVLPVAIVGGMDSIQGCIIGGIIVGIGENIAAVYIDPSLPHSGGFRIVIPYLMMLMILIIKPYGLFGLKRIERM